MTFSCACGQEFDCFSDLKYHVYGATGGEIRCLEARIAENPDACPCCGYGDGPCAEQLADAKGDAAYDREHGR